MHFAHAMILQQSLQWARQRYRMQQVCPVACLNRPRYLTTSLPSPLTIQAWQLSSNYVRKKKLCCIMLLLGIGPPQQVVRKSLEDGPYVYLTKGVQDCLAC